VKAEGGIFCENTIAKLSVSGPNVTSFAWKGPNTYASNEQNPSIQNVGLNLSGVFSVLVAAANGCTGTATASIVVNPQPKISVSKEKTTVCIGGDLKLQASGGESYAWFGLRGFTSSLASPVLKNVTNIVPEIYTVVGAGKNNCSATSTVSVVAVVPETIAVKSNSPLCSGTTLKLDAQNGLGYVWFGPNGFMSGAQSPTISGTNIQTSGNYAVIAIDKNRCTSTAAVNVVVNSKPVAVANSPICEGGSIQLNATGGTGSITWVGPNGFRSVLQNPAINGVSSVNSGVYTVSILGRGGCTGLATVRVAIGSKLTFGARAIAVTCNNGVSQQNGQIVLTGFSAGDRFDIAEGPTYNGRDSYASATPIPASGIIANDLENPSSPTRTYTVRMFGSSGCFGDQTVTLIRTDCGTCIKPNAGDDFTICGPLTDTQLLPAQVGQVWTAAANNPAPANITQNGLVTGMTRDGEYRFTLTYTAGGSTCSSTITITRSTLDGGDDVSICGTTSSVKLKAAGVGQTWDADDTNPVNATIDQTGQVRGLTATGVYRFVLSNASCVSVVTITKLDKPEFIAEARPATCSGTVPNKDAFIILTKFFTSDRYDIVEGTTYTGTKTYATSAFIPGDGIILANLPSPLSPQSFTIRVFNSGGCFTDVTVTLEPSQCFLADQGTPTFKATAINATCGTDGPNNDAKIVLSQYNIANRYDYLEGAVYDRNLNFGLASIIPKDGIIARNLPNPSTAKYYTVRVLNGRNEYTDQVVKIEPTKCKQTQGVVVVMAPNSATRLAHPEPQPEQTQAEPVVMVSYPNPFDNELGVVVTATQTQKGVLTMHTLAGVPVQVFYEGEISSSENKMAFDTRHLPEGTYLLTLVTGSSVVTKKVVLRR
jgi:hypothetical protein